MPPQGEQNNNQEVAPTVTTPEVVSSQEVPTTPEAPVEPAKENFQDQAAPVQPVPVSAPDDPVASTKPASIVEAPDADETNVSEIDSKWVGAVNQVIEKDKNKPYEEEEEAESLQIKYLFKRFGKLLKKDKE